MVLPEFLQQDPNLKITLLTPEDQAALDASGNIRNLLGRIPASPEEEFFADLNPFVSIPEPFQLLAEHRLTLGSRHDPYVRYCNEMDSKIGRQGGKFNQVQHLRTIQEYFVPGCKGNIPTVFYLARDLLIRMIKEKIEQVGYPQFEPKALLKTFAACPTGLSKGTFTAETVGVNRVSLQKFFPTTPGQRRMRNKDRGIFMDAVANVRAEERFTTAARNWLKKWFPEFFGSWLAPTLFVRPALTTGISKRYTWVFWDYHHMDCNFRKRVMMELIYPVYEVLFPGDALKIGCYFEQNFDQPIYCGNYLIEGTHSLLSGANITNDCETLYTVILALATVLDPNKLKVLVALGDDMALALKASERQARAVLDQAIDLSGQLDMVISAEKSGISSESITYCRCVYYPSGRRDAEGVLFGAYPTNLVLNNIVQPEKPIFEEVTSLAADLQRLDGAIGSPDWHYAVQLFSRYNNYQLLKSKDLSNACAQLEKVDVDDWWMRLYGERWRPASSPSFMKAFELTRKTH
jgi:hypothetical protein